MTSISEFDYDLPERLIAQRPAPDRDASRLMVLDRAGKTFRHSAFGEFPSLLKSGDVMVVNNTKVFPARLAGTRASGGKIEILLTSHRGNGVWEAMTRGLSKLRAGETVSVHGGKVKLVEKLPEGFGVYEFGSEEEAWRIIAKAGAIPLPPYIKRPSGAADADDAARYQTVFAQNTGSCAAPTAGLHFTQAIMDSIAARGVKIVRLTLHVGPGTFRPVKAENIEDHVMDPEYYEIPPETASVVNEAKRCGARIVAVGSTVTRCLETAADDSRTIIAGTGETSLFIKPGWRFKIADAMLTNFHLPKSTLLVLVSAFAGRDLAMQAYKEAVSMEYRFFSYGDAMFIQ
ncbi:MAG: tRNA preQ1(34) S-adenosylmethionine ribosyltransferase-isomerase QueA [Nitrospinae bacterium]|nr:tRNA preQ1(34) S-adenosylmethionine ribosyltransferase-isomerase QueA [Nitrospinota bacterium]